jgi:hypothetical protein
LYLDVWAPQYANAGSVLPVKVWIYGGSDTAGGISDSFYDGCAVADAGALLVSINYRLGPLGFLALETAGIPGNQGISDILMGLQWVQDNIAAFGGDPVGPIQCLVKTYWDLRMAANEFGLEKSPSARSIGGRDRCLHNCVAASGPSVDERSRNAIRWGTRSPIERHRPDSWIELCTGSQLQCHNCKL